MAIRHLILVASLAAALAAPTARAAEPAGGTFAVTGVTVHTARPGEAPLPAAVVVVVAGRIACIGAAPSGQAPAGAQACAVPFGAAVYDFAGKGVLVPGLIEALARVGQIEVDAEESSHDGVPGRESNLAHVRAIDGISTVSRAVEAARSGGVTTVVTRPLGGALITGQSVAFRTKGEVVDASTVRNPVAIHVNLGEQAKQGEQPLVGARSGQVAQLRAYLERARRLADADAGKKPKDAAGLESLQRLRDDPALVALSQVFGRKLPLVVHAHRADDIAAALRLQQELGFRLVVAGGAEAHVLAERLAAAKVPVLLGPVRERPDHFATKRATRESAARLHQAGVQLGLASADTHNARHLRWEAGFAVAAGLPWAVALRAVTRDVAAILELGPGVGELSVGAVADFAVYDGDPLTLAGHVVFVTCGGVADPAPTQR